MWLQELLDWREKYKNQARELKETLNKLKVTTEQYNEANDGLVVWMSIAYIVLHSSVKQPV